MLHFLEHLLLVLLDYFLVPRTTAGFVVIPVTKQFSDQAKTKDTLQLTNDMSKVLQKLLKYFNGTTIAKFF